MTEASAKFYSNLSEQAEQALLAAGMNSKIIIQVGSATCERAAGAGEVKKELEKLIMASGRDDIVLKNVGCTGRCAREPIVGVFAPQEIPIKYEKVSVDKVATIFQEHIVGKHPVSSMVLDKTSDAQYQYVITVCSSHRCDPNRDGAPERQVQQALDAQNIAPGTVRVFGGGCFGMCSAGRSEKRVMMVLPEKVVYAFGSDEELAEIIESHIGNGTVCEKHRTNLDFIVEQFFSRYGDVAFFNKQTRLTLRNSGLIDPESIDDYIHNKGYKALADILDAGDAGKVLDEISESGLRGRGGGGFPTGMKWKFAAREKDPVKYIICNADEGDPGAFMDRSALEGDPFIVLEGMTIGAYAIGATQGYIYCRAEYPLAIERLEKAIAAARSRGLLGKGIMGSSFDFDIEIRLGAGAFVCGEETALIYSIEGQRGQPRIRPPYPTTSGLWGHPTVINNVETFANVPTIMLYGAKWYSKIGTEGSRGTKVFALAGKVQNTGLVEVPMGTTLKDIIFDIGGGLEEGRTLKAVQTGGPSGGCIPIEEIDTPVDYETLRDLGSIMGSGGMIVLDDTDCIVSTAKFFLEFTQSESCGKCVPCREGTLRMLEILEKITLGQATLEDLDVLERLALMIQKTSLCGLGQSAPNPVLSTLKAFRSEFETHVLDKKCPAHRCANLVQYEVIPENCTGCTLCAKRCPVSCIDGGRKEVHFIRQDECIKCGECLHSCKFNAIRLN